MVNCTLEDDLALLDFNNSEATIVKKDEKKVTTVKLPFYGIVFCGQGRNTVPMGLPVFLTRAPPDITQDLDYVIPLGCHWRLFTRPLQFFLRLSDGYLLLLGC